MIILQLQYVMVVIFNHNNTVEILTMHKVIMHKSW
jgi:hypothetical protein